ncbi:hypothetical protein [Pedobacter sp. Hv1]|uniref:hypothetical protein n=1 Tax=Pedobacter sp. Hv1 TaxID=1740090 RepID=UPI0006D8AA16|nr:hypothetical protein [Pedobacter sp. Hv1]KQC00423.1 hypothetical protein AQF98_13165 [Pedobacter sp. Hv1]
MKKVKQPINLSRSELKNILGGGDPPLQNAPCRYCTKQYADGSWGAMALNEPFPESCAKWACLGSEDPECELPPLP